MNSVHIQSCSGPHFSRIWTEYGEIRSISPYSVRMRENADQNNSEYSHFLRSELNDLDISIEDSVNNYFVVFKKFPSYAPHINF